MIIHAKQRRKFSGDARSSAIQNVSRRWEMNFLRHIVDWVRSRVGAMRKAVGCWAQKLHPIPSPRPSQVCGAERIDPYSRRSLKIFTKDSAIPLLSGE